MLTTVIVSYIEATEATNPLCTHFEACTEIINAFKYCE